MQKAEQKLILSTILRVLEAKGISKLALAKNIGVAPSTIARWFKKQDATFPHKTQLQHVAVALGIDYASLLTGLVRPVAVQVVTRPKSAPTEVTLRLKVAAEYFCVVELEPGQKFTEELRTKFLQRIDRKLAQHVQLNMTGLCVDLPVGYRVKSSGVTNTTELS